MIEHLHVYYSNDLHSHFEQWTKIVSYLKEKEKLHHNNKENYWTVDIGDHADRFHPITEATLGKSNVELLNDASYDIATIGNNEGITLDYQDLFHLYDDADFHVSCANLLPQKGPLPKWLKEYHIVHSESGVKIAFIGLTAPFTPFYNPLGWKVESPINYLARRLPEMKKNADIIILLSHLGLTEDQIIAEQFHEIDIIIGGHTHHLFKNGEVINGTLLTAAGKYGHYVGEVHLEWDHENRELIHKEAYAVPINHYKDDKQTTAKLDQLAIKADKQLNRIITSVEAPLDVNWYESTPIIEQFTSYLLKWTDADVSMLNAGILLDSIGKGAITFKDIHSICPHPINPCVVELTGKELMEVVRGAFDEELIHLEVKGFGFRGKVVGKMIFAGITVETSQDKNGKEHVKEIYYQNESLHSDKIYKLATADMFTFGRMFPVIVRAKQKRFYLPEFMRDLLASMLKETV
ncbi:bifunctional metallophosphatase/5'-nucleotidase [Gracilibacillus marinus]|jgi:5'-nucleotidase|uniref:Bifunctional metallophosphatase/5'-nucleotidase n=1 Tax=Gracilibacillus marinus TaxID=630535 RepID=A0ABV8VT76_9BACI